MEKLPSQAKLAVVTGATRGIGLAIARKLLEQGCRVVGCHLHDESAAAALAELGDLATEFIPVRADLGNINGIECIVAAVRKENRRLTYLISNVGVTDKTSFEQVEPEQWERVLRTNLTVPFFLVQRLAPMLQDNEGRIVFIGAVMGIRPHPMSFSYGASKAGLHFLAQCLVKALSPRGITVNVVAPGFVETAMQAGKAPDHRRRVENKISLRRFATPEEVAAGVETFFEQGYVTGQILCVDGGYDFE